MLAQDFTAPVTGGGQPFQIILLLGDREIPENLRRYICENLFSQVYYQEKKRMALDSSPAW
jgi:hypothetical protein